MGNVFDELFYVDIAHKSDYLENSTGDLDVIRGKENIKNHIFHTIVTEKGALIHRPDWGVGIKSFQNEPNSIANQLEIADRIKKDLEKDSRIEEVKEVSLLRDDEAYDMVRIRVVALLAGIGETTIEEVFENG